MSDDLRQAALEYHEFPKPGKIEVVPTKPLANQRDLALAYSPGVAAACNAIVDDPAAVNKTTARGNLVAVISNGTAVLGLGDIGPLASKPVMEGKGVLFKKFANIDVFDIEIDEKDPDKLVDIIASLEPTFGGINLEDIKSPECFEIEQKLKERCNIPIFHDDQHGTAIITASALINALRIVDKEIDKVKLACSGAGAAAMACLDLLVSLGMKKENIMVCDSKGVIYDGRDEGVQKGRKKDYLRQTDARTLADAIKDADVFLGVSVPGMVTQDMVKSMGDKPIILALSNPIPEILPEEAKEARPDCIMATGRSDYPNQVNNVLCFPYIFRGALDVGATTINEEMKMASVRAIADLALAESHDLVVAAYGGKPLAFGPEYLIPKPFDPRLISTVAPAVAQAAIDSGVATKNIDMDEYRLRLTEFVFRSGMVMKPVFERARQEQKRVVYAEGEEERVLQAVQVAVDDKLVSPILIGRRDVVKMRLKKLGLRIRPDVDFELADPEDDPRYREYWTMYHKIMGRSGVSPDHARTIVRTRNTVIASLMVKRGEADAMICGAVGRFHRHMKHVVDVIGKRPGVRNYYTMNALMLPKGSIFICDTFVNAEPNAHQIAEMAVLAADEVRRFGITPKVALVSHSNFGSSETETASKMREALKLIESRDPSLEVDGEMTASAALDGLVREKYLSDSKLTGSANLLIMPNLDAANIAFNLAKQATNAISIGPILLGADKPAHILNSSTSVRGIVNMSALANVDAQMLNPASEE